MSTRVRKGNKILSVADDAIDRYMSAGYSVIDETGEVVNKATPVDVSTLKMEYAKMADEIENFKCEVEALKTANASLQADKDYLTQENKKLTAELSVLKSSSEPEKAVEKPTTRKRKQSTDTEAKG